MRFSLVFHHYNKEFVSLESAEERQSWKTSAHMCGWLFLARFRSFYQWKFSPLNNVVLAGDFLVTWRLLRKIQFNKKSDIPNTSCVELFRKQIFQKLYTLKIFRKTISLCLKLEQTLIFSLLTLFLHRWFFSPKWARAWAHVRGRRAMTWPFAFFSSALKKC